MPNPEKPPFPDKISKYSFLITAVFSMTALVATFLVSGSALSFQVKTAIFLTIFIVYLFLTIVFYWWQKAIREELRVGNSVTSFSEEIERKLLVLEEANEFFGASLKTDDMFRLVASRTGEIIPFATCVLFLRDEKTNNLKIRYAMGKNSDQFTKFNANINRSLAAKVFLSRQGLLDAELFFDKRVFSDNLLKNFGSAVAVPLVHQQEVFGVLVLYSEKDFIYRKDSLLLIGAVGERVAPLLVNSLNVEQNLENALTDSLTGLPNERAFYLMLENQIAESVRYQNERPLTILAIDIQDFDELNKKYGHATGDRILKLTAVTIKKQLRQMDFLSRLSGDEFLAILPTTNSEIAEKIIKRIKRAFIVTPFEISESNKVHFQLNFGVASFGRDGETAQELLRIALLRKLQNKSAENNKIIWFPQEFVD